jgi:hypothetical protein
MNLRRSAIRIVAALACVLALSSCFIPDKFEAEIRLTRDGSYGVTFIGILTYGPLFSQIVRGEIDDAKAKENNRMFLEQLKRETFFKSVEPLGRGRFQVRYERTGKFAGRHQTVTFVSRQEPIFRVLTTEKGTVEVNGSGQGKLYADRLEEVGLTTSGLLRVVTDMEVLEHNAQFIRKSPAPGYTQYDWRIRNFRDPSPRFVAKLAVDPRTGVPAYSGGSGMNAEPAEAQ